MSDAISNTPKVKIGGLSRAAQKLQAAREKAEHVKSGAKPMSGNQKALKMNNTFAGTKKTGFQRKSV